MRLRHGVSLLSVLIALALGPIAIRTAPSVPLPPFEPWVFPDGDYVEVAKPAADISPLVPDPTAAQYARIGGEFAGYSFFRIRYASERPDADLVPWIEALYDKRWIKVSGKVQEFEGVKVHAITLENIWTGHKRVLVYVLRVGNLEITSFGIAKLAQIYAKLTGESFFEIVMLSANCAADCSQTANEISGALVRIIRANLPKYNQD